MSEGSGAVGLMRAVSPREWGGPEVLTEVELPRPIPGPCEILVRVHAAGVNATDWKSRAAGGLGLWNDPPVLGHDVSGVVEEVGIGVQIFKPGNEVFGMPRFPLQGGGYAQYVAAPARHFAAKPARLDHVHAAALPLCSLTAWQALFESARLQAGQRVLVHAAAGGFGHLAVQIAKAYGAEVIGTARADKHAFLRGLGVDEAVDYTEVDFTEAVRDVDIVLDPVGGSYGRRSLSVLRPGGTLVSLASISDAALAPEAAAHGLRAGFMLVEPDHGALASVAALADRGALRPEIAATLPLAEASRAHRLGESARTTGKIVLTVS